jgi:hypothetical protein
VKLEAMAEGTALVAAAQKVARLLRDLETYVSGQSEIIIDYATARRCTNPSLRRSPRARCSGCYIDA